MCRRNHYEPFNRATHRLHHASVDRSFAPAAVAASGFTVSARQMFDLLTAGTAHFSTVWSIDSYEFYLRGSDSLQWQHFGTTVVCFELIQDRFM
jgi:hypothetical protein